MTIRKTGLLIGLGLLQAHAAWAGPVEDAMNADRAFSKMAQDKGVAEAFGAYAAPNGIRFVPGNLERGPDVIKASVAKESADGGKLTWEPKEGVPSNDGSLVVVWGRWTYEAPDKARTTRHGTYLTVWQKQTDGRWLFTHDIGNADPKPAP